MSPVDERPRSGSPRETRTNGAVNAVSESIRKNTFRKQKIITREMKSSPRTTSRIIIKYLGCGVYRKCTGQRLTEALRQLKLQKRKSYFSCTRIMVIDKYCL